MSKNNQIELPFFETLLLLVGCILTAGIYQLTFDVYTPFRSVFYGIVGFGFIYTLFNFKFKLKEVRFDWIIGAILFLSFLLRLNPWLYLEGGQDQGVYVAMSKQFELSNGLTYKDNVVDQLTSQLKTKYNSTLGWKALGFERQIESGEISTNFYPAHPLSMSIFGWLLGSENRVLSLTFFSIISIYAAYLLTFEVTGNRLSGYVSATLISLSPLHIYFSKFPVTEIMTLALNLSFLFFMLKAWKGNKGYLYIALLTINVLLFTRLTWVVAIPFFLIAITTVLAFENDSEEYKKWGRFGIGLLIAFTIAIVFYYFKIPFLYTHFFADIFKYIPQYIFYPFIILSPLIIYILTSVFKTFTQKLLMLLFKYRVWIFVLVMILLVYVSCKNFYNMVFTDRYIGSLYDYFWGMARGGWIVIKDMALSSLIIYITPFGLLAFVLSIKSVDTPQKALLMIFVLSYTFFHFFIVKYTPYHFYFARYQLSEIIPLILIFVSMYFVDLHKDKKLIALLLIAPIFLYSVIYLPFIQQGPVGTSTQIFNEIKKTVHENDIVIFYNTLDWSDNFFFSPLKYFYDFNAIRSNSFDDVVEYSMKISNPNKYIISTTKITDSRFNYVKTLRYTKTFYANAKEDHPPLNYDITNWQIPFCSKHIPEKFCSGVIPIQYHKASLDFYLYNYKEIN